ncbi:MAG: hypothetical protein G01um101466_40 [Parcubacteria group bacterium Gr01-1014_66]|nr:MAG: hypothetical protein G01um101466_40 [Parcubacteria group bacterium Gr01-1014_66]
MATQKLVELLTRVQFPLAAQERIKISRIIGIDKLTIKMSVKGIEGYFKT